MIRGSRIVCLATAVMAAGAANAQPLKAIRAQEAEESHLAREVAYTNSVCRADLSGRIDWKSTRGWPDRVSLAGACDLALGALEAVCRSGKSAAGLSSFVCAGDGSGLELRGSVLRYGARPGGDSLSSLRGYLESAL